MGEGEVRRVHAPPAGEGRQAKFVAEVSKSEERIKELVHARAEHSSVEKEGLEHQHGASEAHDPHAAGEKGYAAGDRAQCSGRNACSLSSTFLLMA